MKRLLTLPVSLQTGSTPIETIALGATFPRVRVALSRCTSATPSLWPSKETVAAMALEVSYDGGETWHGGGAYSGDAGSVRLGKSGAELPSSGATFLYPSVPTHLRGSITVENGPLESELLIEAD